MLALQGRDLKQIRDSLGLSSEEICAEAQVSMSSLRAAFLDDPKLRPRTRVRVIQALERLKNRKAAG
jgi:predicted transcriptional regulator